jgi:prepilin-type N-terminal cleavage/methylation domain-containing protein
MLMSATVEEIHGDGTGMTNGRKSFTLIELLVTISIIGILTGMLLTSLSKTKEQAHRVECINAQRQFKIFYYVDDWDKGTTEVHPSYTKKELTETYPKILNSCYGCHDNP